MADRADPRTALMFVDTAAEREAVVAHLSAAGTEPRRSSGYEVWRVDGADWEVAVAVAGADGRDPRATCEEAIEILDPALLLFLGLALAANGAHPGTVVAAERISRAYPPREDRVRRPATRAVSDDELLRHAYRVCADDAWVERLRSSPDGVGQAHVGHVVTGHIRAEGESAPEAVALVLGDAAALVPDRWVHVQALYGDENLPALAICVVVRSLEADEHGAIDRALSLALTLLATNPVSTADKLRSVVDAGVKDHGQTDIEGLSVEQPEGFLQRRFITTAQAPNSLRRQGNGTKERLGKARVGALIQTAGSSQRAVPPPDLEISIELQDGELVFFLSVADDRPGLPARRHKRVGSKRLSGEFGGSPLEYRENLMRKIEHLVRDPPEDGAEELKMLGTKLFEDLFPAELKNEYADFRDKIETLWITSDEPWIPWEMVCPYGDWGYDDHLAARFDLTRWNGEGGPKLRFAISHIALLEAGTVEGEPILESAADECSHLAGLARARAVRDLSPARADRDAIRRLLRRQEDIHLWHVAAHGRLDVRQNPLRNSIVLHGGCWASGELTGVYRVEVSKARPLVFFNACLVGRQDFSLAKLEGWPSAWLESSCGAFLGPQWSLDSDLAAKFSKTFYDALAEGAKLGLAAKMARAAVRQMAPNDPAWLSYAVYGNPNAEVEFIGDPEGAPA